ncbi:MAG: HlyD family efflux transporter periplasmic adaptor subunit [Phenylobacterium sp.]|jgi:HlyD family secretion protein|uniref:efflux RND transporter periplasmic adaptor subunit n=1 Tax=Phenylobacterium sp. TaxID=1871053 RepID=UPI002A36CD5F|nr:HlyD family efflux transporter periplasmic adaptor subunit [Phenylobacterium sp.]MDX9997500.1 HlyD family efflux transporter periplasmic adaptor subunit [Phenylobacterium sp.]
MRLRWSFRTVFWGVAALVLAVLLLLAFRPQARPVEMAEVSRGELVVQVRDEGRTRVREAYVVSAPLAGRLLRIGNRAGEAVEAGEVVAIIEPSDPTLLDERTRRETQAAARSAEAALALSREEQRRADAQLAHARREADRIERLAASGFAARSALDRVRLDLASAEAAAKAAQAAVGVRAAELEAARARLITPDQIGSGGRSVEIRAPAAGRILRVLQESESVVATGAPILEVGDPGGLEVVAEFLSSDAVQVQPGAEALIDAWGGAALPGRVRLVEPFGFLKVSALGVEEQRVNVVIDFQQPPPAGLGHGYRVEAAVAVWRGRDVLRAPVAALFRRDGQWAVFEVEKGRARLRQVEAGRNNGEWVEIRSGLSEGDVVVLHPDRELSDGDRVRRRASS